MEALFKRFFHEEEGLELVEYAVMTSLIVAALVPVVMVLAGAIFSRFGEAQGVIESVAP